MKSKAIRVGVCSDQQQLAAFKKAWKRAERGLPPPEPVDRLYFPDTTTMFRALSRSRLQLLSMLRQSGTISVLALAKALGRDYKNVYEDVKALKRFGLMSWEFPRLCRGGSRRLTFTGVISSASGYHSSLRRNWRFFSAIDIMRLFPWLRGFAFHRLRSAPFEGAAIGIPPALPEDCYSSGEGRCVRAFRPDPDGRGDQAGGVIIGSGPTRESSARRLDCAMGRPAAYGGRKQNRAEVHV